MHSEMGRVEQPRLSQPWRRGLVCAGSAAAAGIAVLNAMPVGYPRMRLVGMLAMVMVLLACLWLLADSVRPWLSERGVGPITCTFLRW